MTRFKKEVRKLGFLTEEDYEYLPYHGVEAIIVDAEKASVKYVYNCCDDELYKFDRSMGYTSVSISGWSIPEFTRNNY